MKENSLFLYILLKTVNLLSWKLRAKVKSWIGQADNGNWVNLRAHLNVQSTSINLIKEIFRNPENVTTL